jgi:hypothetical protein
MPEATKYLIGAIFRVWGEKGTKRRFLQWVHSEIPGGSVTLLLEEAHISQLLDALQRELPPEAYTDTHRVQ